MSRAERDSSKGQEMQEHIQDLIEELKEAEEATGRFQRSVGSYYDSMMKAADDLQNTEFSVLMLLMILESERLWKWESPWKT